MPLTGRGALLAGGAAAIGVAMSLPATVSADLAARAEDRVPSSKDAARLPAPVAPSAT